MWRYCMKKIIVISIAVKHLKVDEINSCLDHESFVPLSKLLAYLKLKLVLAF